MKIVKIRERSRNAHLARELLPLHREMRSRKDLQDNFLTCVYQRSRMKFFYFCKLNKRACIYAFARTSEAAISSRECGDLYSLPTMTLLWLTLARKKSDHNCAFLYRRKRPKVEAHLCVYAAKGISARSLDIFPQKSICTHWQSRAASDRITKCSAFFA